MSKVEYEALVAASIADKPSERQVPSSMPSAEVRHHIEEAETKNDEPIREVAPGKHQIVENSGLYSTRIAGIGGSTKRRLAKIVGDEEPEDESLHDKTSSRKNGQKVGPKRRKKMMLSFNEEGTEG